jgi:hypothetical protein
MSAALPKILAFLLVLGQEKADIRLGNDGDHVQKPLLRSPGDSEAHKRNGKQEQTRCGASVTPVRL